MKIPSLVIKEVLSHIRCGECEQWFVISEALPNRTEWTCPHCRADIVTIPATEKELELARTTIRVLDESKRPDEFNV